jgi:hypothetical protein
LHNIVSLDMAAGERDGDYLDAFLGDKMEPDTGSSFREWYQGYILGNGRRDRFVGSDKHLRSLVGRTKKEWNEMATILGNKALADTFDILRIVRAKLEVLLLEYPGPSDDKNDDSDNDDSDDDSDDDNDDSDKCPSHHKNDDDNDDNADDSDDDSDNDDRDN